MNSRKSKKGGGRSDKPVLTTGFLYPHLSKFGGVKNHGHQKSTPEKFENYDGRLYK
jgi:hypothetical protein